MPINTIPHDAETMLVHVLNVGHGDAIIVELPEVNNQRAYIVVDCYIASKTLDYLNLLGAQSLDLVVATHPHSDHIKGLKKILESYSLKVEQFWDSGFRHSTTTWLNLMDLIESRDDILFIRPTSGLILTINGVEITVLGPSVALRNRYDSYGVNINNASIVLKLEYNDKKVILTGDAQWDSWAKITEDFPHFKKTSNPDQKIKYTEAFNPLKCNVLKVSHHGSMHGTSLEYIERLSPNHAVISSGTRFDLPHEITTEILDEVEIKTTNTLQGTVVYTINRSIKCYQCNDASDQDPIPDNFQKMF
ncbi:MAG: MBL fold metallo-hydrolase [Candidatus Heimdallarchaeota archaeon]|nr:MBL fold metallo-hydrolase [Candidatus Heimdallarchaeota archaeon]MCK4771043.1 MBL fold metallo-hydrolase [Candidatus Heimdallarchaeota archaeon]